MRISLLRAGAYTIGSDINWALTGAEVVPLSRDQHPNLLVAPFRTRAGGYVQLLMLQGDRFWPRFCSAVAHPEWEHDPRFATLADRAGNAAQLDEALAPVLAEKTRDEWAEILRPRGHLVGPGPDDGRGDRRSGHGRGGRLGVAARA